MAHELVKILSDDDGETVVNPKWHIVFTTDGTSRTLCSGEAFGFGESSATFETKIVQRGGIDCPKCMEWLRHFKSIKL